MAVIHQELHHTVIVEIGGGYTVAVERLGDTRTGIERDILELAIVPIPVEQFALSEGAAQGASVQFRVDVAICHEEVGPSVVINIHKERAPAQELRVASKAGLVSDVRECA